ncbi:unnamed protein product [Microthlaspi erraticum]|uniref:Uncharacterized protein n=1 Tax=Microthlaspi erraticum TaxID=1685480 RepID=A0A6D2JZC4_9BRAS|nr:unnamed protein product [Microthlaspi erraticum]
MGANWSGMRHEGSWHDLVGETCQFPDTDRRFSKTWFSNPTPAIQHPVSQPIQHPVILSFRGKVFKTIPRLSLNIRIPVFQAIQHPVFLNFPFLTLNFLIPVFQAIQHPVYLNFPLLSLNFKNPFTLSSLLQRLDHPPTTSSPFH